MRVLQALITSPFLLLALVLGITFVGEAYLVCHVDQTINRCAANSRITPAPPLPVELQTFVRDSACRNEWFGAALALTDSTVLIGCPRQSIDGSSLGAVHLFQRGPHGQWHTAHEFARPELAAGAQFGSSVAASAGRVLIGVCPLDVQPAAAPVAYAYEQIAGQWRSAPLLMEIVGPSELISVSLALDGDTAIVGQIARSVDPDRLSAQTCLFRAQPDGSWRRLATFAENDDSGPLLHSFGNSVAISGSRAIVGAPLVNTRGGTIGVAYIYEEDEHGVWRRVAALSANDDERANCFGNSVAISGNTAIVGAMAANAAGRNSGAAHVFREIDGQWRRIATLVPNELQPWSCFGRSVALDRDLALIGAPGENDGAGAIYAFHLRASGVEQLAHVAPRGTTPRAGFGQCVSIAGHTLLAGAPWEDLADQENTGAAYACELHQPPTTAKLYHRQAGLLFARQSSPLPTR